VFVDIPSLRVEQHARIRTREKESLASLQKRTHPSSPAFKLFLLGIALDFTVKKARRLRRPEVVLSSTCE